MTEEALSQTRNMPAAGGDRHFLSTQSIADALVAFSMANLCFICSSFSLLHDADWGYFNKLRVDAPSLLALLANFLWLSIALWLGLRVRDRFKRPSVDLVCGLLFGALLLIPLEFCRVFVLHLPMHRLVPMVKNPFGFATCLTVFGAVAWKPSKAARLPMILAGILSPLAFLSLGKIVLVLLGITQIRQHAGDPPLAQTKPAQSNRPRVIWIIFDETDERLAFEQRPAGLLLPEFDRLRQQSVFATNAYPPADATLLSMPSLTLGERVAAASPFSASDLKLTLADTNISVNWSEQRSVFDSARELGCNTAVVGWYHPYSRVFARTISSCDWFPIPNFEIARAKDFAKTMQMQISAMRGGWHIRQCFVDLCPACLASALPLMTNSAYGLALLHLPLPHQPGIYLPQEDRLTARGMLRTTGYFNNLVLADHWLGKLRRALDSSPLATNTWLLVSSDHSWRESRLYDNVRDYRVPFLLKAPGQTAPSLFSSQINTVVTHDLILAILSGQFSGPNDALAWLKTRTTDQLQVPANASDEAL